MGGLRFEQKLLEREDPRRTDVALFMGFVHERSSTVPERLRRWLWERGIDDKAESLEDVPVPVTSWGDFHEAYAWERRPLGAGEGLAASYLGAAVRSFFAQGGRKCYVVRVGDPLSPGAERALRQRALTRLLPGFRPGSLGLDVDRSDRRTWSGIGHVFRLPEISFLSLPDLPDLLRSDVPAPAADVVFMQPPVAFSACSEGGTTLEENSTTARYPAPACDAHDYSLWGGVIAAACEFLRTHAREVQLVTAVPLPVPGEAVSPARLFQHVPESAFIQLCFPWLRSTLAVPGALEPPDGALVGVLARNALSQGTFRSAADQPLAGVGGVLPLLDRSQTVSRIDSGAAERSLVERVSLFGFSPGGGIRLLSDVTASKSESYRPAAVNRLVSVVVRAARSLGEAVVFDNSGERLWTDIRSRLVRLLEALYEAGVLRGASPAEAFDVRCDRSTMTQQDIDQGRVVVRIRFEAAIPIETITVVLTLHQGGGVSLAEADGRSAA